jgi:hypothetical protein
MSNVLIALVTKNAASRSVGSIDPVATEIEGIH